MLGIKDINHTPNLFLDVEDKTAEARTKFTEIEECTYSSKNIGSSGQNEYMMCDCLEDWDSEAQKNLACSEDSDCINRVTSVECVNKHSHCGKDCQNQRFQKKQYANISIFLTELKGYGVRAMENIPENTFIYEYIGEVIDEDAFRQRMIEYDQKNLKHFYFMMLKNDSFIDATIKGSLARFCNHSCNPNAYVDKWVVGDKLRMGIFSKRPIQEGEEVTFDYNVDRYGAQSQECFCGEPNCVKFMGGKTQTNAVSLLPDGIAEVLGVTGKQEKQWLRENKHLKNELSDDTELAKIFVNSVVVHSLNEQDVSKVMSAMMKVQEFFILEKLIERVYLTNDEGVNLLVIKFHGYKTFSKLISSNFNKDEFIRKILIILKKWPKMTKNKISSSQIESVIKDLKNRSEDEEIIDLASSLLEDWSQLQMAYRIPKNDTKTSSPALYGRNTRSPERSSTPQEDEAPLPDGWEQGIDPNTQKPYYFHRELNLSRWDRPTIAVPKGPKGPKFEPKRPSNKSFQDIELSRREEERIRREKEEQFKEIQQKELLLQEMISKSQKEFEEKKKLELKLKMEKREKEKEKAKLKKKAPSMSIEQQWTKLFASCIPNFVKKHESEIGRDNIKGCARDLVKILVEKELKKDPKSEPPSEFDSKKLKKIKEYSKTFMEKFLMKYRSKHSKRKLPENTDTEPETKQKKLE